MDHGDFGVWMSVGPAWVEHMAALPLEHPGPDTPAVLLAALEDNHTTLLDSEARQFQMAAEWAAAHPVEGLGEAATVEGSEGELAIAGAGAPLVAEFCVADFALAIGVSTDAGRAYLGDAVEVFHRLPRLWEQVMAGRVPVWRARRIAGHTHSLPMDAAGYVDRHVAPVAARVSFAQLDRTVAAARALFDPIEAEHRRLLAADGRFCAVDTTQVSLNGTMTIRGELDLADALDLDHALATGAQALADLGCAETVDVRRALAVGILARGEHALDLPPAEPGQPVPAATTTVPVKRRGRELVLYTHLTDDAVTGILATVENTARKSWSARSPTGASPRPARSPSARSWTWTSISRSPATPPPHAYANKSFSPIRPVSSRTAPDPHGAATSTTSSPGPRAARRVRAIWSRPAGSTTG